MVSARSNDLSASARRPSLASARPLRVQSRASFGAFVSATRLRSAACAKSPARSAAVTASTASVVWAEADGPIATSSASASQRRLTKDIGHRMLEPTRIESHSGPSTTVVPFA